jgi:formyl-CoA transferase
MNYLLEDITVIDAATFLAGPGAATIMADFGANVVKIEPPGGDGYRSLVGGYATPYHWLMTSRNKKSLALDLTTTAGQELLHRLIGQADVLTTNFLQPNLERYQLEYERLKAINPRLIYAHISGFGLEGPDVERRAFDITAWWARSGMMEFVRDQEQTPLAPAPGMGDHSTATALFGAIMTGLYRRERTGEGCQVSTSLAANGVWANSMAIQGVVAGNDLGQHRQKRGWVNPFTGCYRTADDQYLVFAMMTPMKEWPNFCAALGHPEWQQDERFASLRSIMKHRGDLVALMSDALGKMELKTACAALDQYDVTYERVQAMAEVLDDAQLRAAGIVVETGDPVGDYDLTINSPISVLEEGKKPPTRAPDIGENSTEVLADFGLDQDEIRALVDNKVVIAGG